MTDYYGKEISLDKILLDVRPGWHPLITTLVEDLGKLGWDGQVCQVKEKFGGLRFYIGAKSDEIQLRITEAEKQSYKICEICGEPGTLVKLGWLMTRCPEHSKT
tara:strand:+ start:78 stop:389 length:312 start_codon:yes stop_codon:yes gene_type:complete